MSDSDMTFLDAGRQFGWDYQRQISQGTNLPSGSASECNCLQTPFFGFFDSFQYIS